jgi:hypothetical protein
MTLELTLQLSRRMSRVRLGYRLLVCLCLASACDGQKDAPSSCPSPAGSITDLAAEPSYSAPYLHRWSIDGCAVRLDVLMTRDSSCGPTDLLMGTPLGASSESGGPRIYVRGDTTGLGGRATGFQRDAGLPTSATDTGFRQGGNELWIVPGDDSFVFVRYPQEGRVEAWPRDPAPIGCF